MSPARPATAAGSVAPGDSSSLAALRESTSGPAGSGPAGIAIVIPAYNEAESLPYVLRALPMIVADRRTEAIVCVDGATDGTDEVARSLGSLTVVSPARRGGGAALRMGFRVAASRGAEIVVTMDADGQHLPSEIERLTRPILEGRADLVVGSRLLGRQAGGSLARRIGVRAFNGLVTCLTLARTTDCASGFRAIRVTALARLTLEEHQFHTAELLIEARRHRLRVVEVPVTIAPRLAGRSKKPGPLPYAWGFARAILRAWWRARWRQGPAR